MQSEIERLSSLVQALTENQTPTVVSEASQQAQDFPRGLDTIQTPVPLSWTSEATREVSQWARPRVSPNTIGSTSIYNLDTGFEPPIHANLSGPGLPRPVWPSGVYDLPYRQATYRCFTEKINAYEHLLEDDFLLSLDLSLNQRLDSVLLLLAVISAATVVRGELEMGDAVSQAAEPCILNASGIPGSSLNLFRALTIFAWRELTVGGSKTRAWLFVCLAAGLLQQLGVFDWTELYIGQTRHTPQYRAQVAAFWAFSHVDRICTALLGRTSTIPWQRICIPRYSSLFEPMEAGSLAIEGLYFDHLWSLWQNQGYYMHTIYSPRFSTLQEPKRQEMLFDCRRALMNMRTSVCPRLSFSSSKSTGHHPFVYFLHMAIETSPMILLLPFLSRTSHQQLSSLLQEMFRSAFNVTDILLQYRKAHPLVKCPPMIVYYLVRSSVFLLLLATSTDTAFERRAARRLKVVLESLEEMQQPWWQQASRAVHFIQSLATRWGVLRALPLRFSYSPAFQLSLQNHNALLHDRIEVDEHTFDASSLDFNFTDADFEAMQSVIANEDIFKAFLEESVSFDS
ncbi:hypothetical protein UA08_08681 [Talaromyces atroroseus]|uniref:Transcription factor domain-containing protein n=1 Tax=Talaromyces atroroseus TaxID=1441469 RepID=A0A225A6R9_TALAT|nr:hypothetical protein UA08_08681 [Talaromyces atroroseus]OKL56112.1 hypothetical protein UA08_08681 [Talaromyces atroroseus]